MAKTATAEKTATKEKPFKRNDEFSIRPENIVVVEGFNVRTEMGDLHELKDSIIEAGLEQPLKVRKLSDTQWKLIDGHRRFAAIKLAIAEGHEFPYIRTFLGKEKSPESEIVSMLITGTGQKRLTEMEQAEGVKRLEALGWDVERIQKVFGKSVSHIYNLKAMNNFSEDVKKHILDGDITATTVLNMTRGEKDVNKQLKLVEEAVTTAKNHAKETGKEFKPVTTKDIKPKSVKVELKLSEAAAFINAKRKKSEKEKWFLQLMEDVKTLSVDKLIKTLS